MRNEGILEASILNCHSDKGRDIRRKAIGRISGMKRPVTFHCQS